MDGKPGMAVAAKPVTTSTNGVASPNRREIAARTSAAVSTANSETFTFVFCAQSGWGIHVGMREDRYEAAVSAWITRARPGTRLGSLSGAGRGHRARPTAAYPRRMRGLCGPGRARVGAPADVPAVRSGQLL
ncbi:Uncharacterised protein [Mycobacteroides abscessus subsp. massiliense]|nr:Uncharacterised protein [Mycobacteroides abscessus subsp. massiliense]